MDMARQMTRIVPKVRIQRRGTPVRPVIRPDVRFVVPRAEIRRVDDSIPRRVIYHVAERCMGVEDVDGGVGVGSFEAQCVLGQRVVEPGYLGCVGGGITPRLVGGGAVQRGQVHEEVGVVA